MLQKYEGNCPANVSKDAKYSVRHHAGRLGVGVLYEYDEEELWHPVSHDHPALVEMVDAIKRRINGVSGGPFYINEFRQVLVPAGNPVTYYLAGEYHEDLEFVVDDMRLSGKPFDLQGRPLEPGDLWTGPHPGILYVLEAGGRDIRYEVQLSEFRRRRRKLSQTVGDDAARRMAQKIATYKGQYGGRFYVNEHRCLFAPVEQEQIPANPVPLRQRWQYIYLGQIEATDPWFPPGEGRPVE